MATLEQVTDAHARRQKAIASRTAARLEQLWRQVDRTNIGSSWRSLLSGALTALSTAQATAAASAGIYTDDALEAMSVSPPAEGRLVSTALAGIASDGRPLTSLLYQPAIKTLTYIGGGAPVDRALAGGLMDLNVIVRTQIADAGRAAESVAIAVRPRVTGYVRMLSQPSCARCIILAGRVYKWNAGFRRHPRCDCRHIPLAEDAPWDVRTDPKAMFDSMSNAEQERAFGKAGAEAVRQGADLSQVVNARRGMQTATVFGREVKTTTEGTSRSRRIRLMPEQILAEANGNRDEAIRLLKLHGYIK